MRNAMLAIIGAFALAGCSKSVEGTYNMVNGPVPGVVATDVLPWNVTAVR
ncbi:hypothetical protein [Sphingomonas paucimobilis]|nr:hypothetical protein [Sphingomonas paucimobilis]MCM3681632.1 hypothetical protein [Sphingomonas paucimobilis]